MEVESNNTLPFLSTKVYTKPTHTGHCLHFDSSHSPHVKKQAVQQDIVKKKKTEM